VAIWTFSGGTTLEVENGHAQVHGDDDLSTWLQADLAMLKHAPIAVQILPPVSENLDLRDPRLVDVWARGVAARHEQTVTTDAQLDKLPPLVDPRALEEHDPTKIY
jgi:hypothetical protein